MSFKFKGSCQQETVAMVKGSCQQETVGFLRRML